jgi:hypothetical protein
VSQIKLKNFKKNLHSIQAFKRLNEDLLEKQESNHDLETRNQELEAANDSFHYHFNDLMLQNQFLECLAYSDSPLAEAFMIPNDSKNKEQIAFIPTR